jgi:glycerophosphoryl diester phosphodiesterase
VLLSSFDPLLLATIALVAPSVPRALLTHEKQPRWAGLIQDVCRPPYVHAVHVERTQVTPGVVARCVRRGLRVGVWTVNDPDEARDFVRQGVATIITDVPGEMLDALGPNGGR